MPKRRAGMYFAVLFLVHFEDEFSPKAVNGAALDQATEIKWKNSKTSSSYRPVTR
jgi:hypothetical protein